MYAKSRNEDFNNYDYSKFFGHFFGDCRSYSEEREKKKITSDFLLISYEASISSEFKRKINNLYLIIKRSCKIGRQDSIFLQNYNFAFNKHLDSQGKTTISNFRYIYSDKGKEELHIYLDQLSLKNIIKQLEFINFSKINILKLKYCVPSRLEIKIIKYLRSGLIKDIDDFIKDSS